MTRGAPAEVRRAPSRRRWLYVLVTAAAVVVIVVALLVPPHLFAVYPTPGK